MDSTLQPRSTLEPVAPALRVAIVVAAMLVVAALIAAAGLAVAYDGKILPGVRAAGVAVGGLTTEAAAARIAERSATLAGQTAQLRADDRTWTPQLGDLGIALDPRQLARQAYLVGRESGSADPLLVALRAPFDSTEVAPAAVSHARVGDWLATAAREFDRPAVDARIELLPNGELRSTPETVGRRLDRERSAAALVAALETWSDSLASGAPFPIALTLPHERLQPAITTASLASAQAETERVLGRTVLLELDEVERRLTRADLATMVTLRREGATVKLDLEQPRLAALAAELAKSIDRAPVDATLAFTPEGKVLATADRPGRKLNQAATVEQLRAAIFGTASPQLTLPAEVTPAKVRAADLAPARSAAERLFAGPVQLRAGDHSFELSPQEIAAMIKLTPAGLAADLSKIEASLPPIAEKIERAPKHARLRIVGGQLEPIEEGVDGHRLDIAAAANATAAALSKGERQIALPVQTIPAFKSTDRAKFGPLEKIEEASTIYAGGAAERTHNVVLAAQRLNGIVVPPGEVFSFNDALGPTTQATGFQWAWGIAGGGANPQTVPSVGGGICQVATTLFHAVFWAGYGIEERNWHLYWIPKYGAPPKGLKGLDATVDFDSNTDLKWKNNSDSPILIQSSTNGSAITFSLYGKKPTWDVEVEGPFISGIRPAQGGTVTQTTWALPPGRSLAVEEARDGFTSRIVRKVHVDGAEPRVLDLTSTFQPSRNVVLVGATRG